MNARTLTGGGAAIRLERYAQPGDDPDQRPQLIAAMQHLSPLFRPLVLALEVESCEPEFRYTASPDPARPFWRLQAAPLPPAIQPTPFLPDPITSTVDTIDEAALTEWLIAATDQPPAAPALGVGWSRLRVLAARARLPDAARPPLQVETLDGDWFHPPQHDGWVDGPTQDSDPQPPLSAVFTRDGGMVTMTLTVGWSIWIDAGQPLLQAATKALKQDGWHLNYRDPYFTFQP